jgi:hypothetical protein
MDSIHPRNSNGRKTLAFEPLGYKEYNHSDVKGKPNQLGWGIIESVPPAVNRFFTKEQRHALNPEKRSGLLSN